MTAVSLEWVLNQLAGGKFPEQGQAYDFIKKSYLASQPDFSVENLASPKEQVGMPNTHKWAVMHKTEGFVDSFKTKTTATQYANLANKIFKGNL